MGSRREGFSKDPAGSVIAGSIAYLCRGGAFSPVPGLLFLSC